MFTIIFLFSLLGTIVTAMANLIGLLCLTLFSGGLNKNGKERRGKNVWE